MNKKQKIVMWIGIVVFLGLSFSYEPDTATIVVIMQSASIVLVTIALTWIFHIKGDSQARIS